MKINIDIHDCSVTEGVHGSHTRKDEFVWKNNGGEIRTVQFDPDTPAIFINTGAPPAPIPVPAYGHASVKLADDAKNEGEWFYSLVECHGTPLGVLQGPHTIIIDI